MEKLETEKNEIENHLKSHTQTSAEKIAELEQQLKEASDKVGVLQLELDSAQQEVGVAKEDARKFSEQVTAAQEMYERELLQHGKSMESLHGVKEEVREGLKLFGERGVKVKKIENVCVCVVQYLLMFVPHCRLLGYRNH